MFTSLSAESRINARLQELDCSVIFICATAGIPATRLNQALRGLKPLSHQDAQLLLDLTQRLVQLRDSLSPVPLGLNDPKQVRSLLGLMDERNIGPEQVKTMVDAVRH